MSGEILPSQGLETRGRRPRGRGISRSLRPSLGYAQTGPTELVHWSWYSASDNTDWSKLIANFNAANKDLQIRQEFVSDDTYGTKILASSATGNAPDFGTAQNGRTAQWAKQGVTVRAGAGAQGGRPRLRGLRPTVARRVHLLRQPAHAADGRVEHGGAAERAVREGRRHRREQASEDRRRAHRVGAEDDRQERAAPSRARDGCWRHRAPCRCVVWSVVALPDGLPPGQRELEGSRCESRGRRARGAVGASTCYDKYQVSSRDIAGSDRYRAYGAGAAAMFFTGPWAIRGYADAKLDFMSFPLPKVGNDTCDLLRGRRHRDVHAERYRTL